MTINDVNEGYTFHFLVQFVVLLPNSMEVMEHVMWNSLVPSFLNVKRNDEKEEIEREREREIIR